MLSPIYTSSCGSQLLRFRTLLKQLHMPKHVANFWEVANWCHRISIDLGFLGFLGSGCAFIDVPLGFFWPEPGALQKLVSCWNAHGWISSLARPKLCAKSTSWIVGLLKKMGPKALELILYGPEEDGSSVRPMHPQIHKLLFKKVRRIGPKLLASRQIWKQPIPLTIQTGSIVYQQLQICN